ncbi:MULTISPECIES: hypothetical protein [unclassified Microcoleus]
MTTSTRGAAIPLGPNRPESQTTDKNQQEVKGRSRDTLFLATSNTQA